MEEVVVGSRVQPSQVGCRRAPFTPAMRPGRSVLRLAALALSGVLLVSCAGSPGSGAPSPQPSVAPPTSTTTPSPTPVPTQTPRADAGLAWQTIAGVPGGHLGAVAAGDGGWVAVGMLHWVDGSESTLVSSDGISWQRLTDPKLYERSWHASVTYGPSGWVIVGRTYTDTPDTTRHEAAAWRSTDMATWTMAPFVPDLDLGCLNIEVPFEGMRDVVAGGPGYVAVGNDCVGAAAWTSKDGLAWRRVTDLPGAADAVIQALVRLEDGTLVAVGHSGGVVNDARASAWSSRDGLTWRAERVSAPGTLVAAATDGTMVIAVPANAGEALSPPLMIRSPEGTWSGIGEPSLSGVRVATLASNGRRWVAFGTRNVQSAVRGDAAWSSDDGWTWTAASEFAYPFPPGFELPGLNPLGVAAVASDGHRFVAVGALPAADPAAGAAASWISPPSGP